MQKLQDRGTTEIVRTRRITLTTAMQYKSEVMSELGVRSLSELMAHAGATGAGRSSMR